MLSCSESELKNSSSLIEVNVSSKLKLEFTDIFESVEVIPLETTDDVLISGITKTLIVDDLIFVLNKSATNTIFCFDKSGKLIFKKASEGMGPNELYSARDFTINKELDQLVVYDGRLGKFLTYDLQGNWKSELKFKGISIYDLINLNGELFFYDGLAVDQNEKVLKLNLGTNITTAININDKDRTIITRGMSPPYFSLSHDEKSAYYKDWGSNSVFEFSENRVLREINFSFSSNEFIPNHTAYEAADYVRELKNKNQYSINSHMIDSKNILLFNIDKGARRELGIWVKSRSTANLVTFSNNMDEICPDFSAIPVDSMMPGFITWAIFPRELKIYLNNKNGNDNAYNDFASKYNVEEDGNPVLFVYKIKDE
jgi:hypothetical protein